ncbi:hypothetical protein [Streptomyces marincola]|uniref:hypothetical protein n=1 Tax=Streptomyces marincola TaxID=2878388 RepID=UPI001CF223AA|nr:hypothetical protein [Streptomyces marincola]UCM89370.1 hypothetical protein LC193_16240 [Streptomyces marincola]
MSTDRCPAPDCARTEDPGGPAPGLCQECRERAAAALAELPSIHSALAMTRTGGSARARERVSGTRGRSAPLRGAAIEARAEALSLLASWSGVVAAGRGLPAPRRDPGPLAAFLLGHLDWLAVHPAAGDFAAELAAALRAARRAAGRDAPVAELGPCVHPGCSATIAGLPDGGAGCPAGHRWGPGQLLLLVHRMRPGGERPAAVAGARRAAA